LFNGTGLLNGVVVLLDECWGGLETRISRKIKANMTKPMDLADLRETGAGEESLWATPPAGQGSS